MSCCVSVINSLSLAHRSQRAAAAASRTPEPGTREYVAEDLKRLIGKKEEEEQEDEDDLPPLLQVRNK